MTQDHPTEQQLERLVSNKPASLLEWNARAWRWVVPVFFYLLLVGTIVLIFIVALLRRSGAVAASLDQVFASPFLQAASSGFLIALFLLALEELRFLHEQDRRIRHAQVVARAHIDDLRNCLQGLPMGMAPLLDNSIPIIHLWDLDNMLKIRQSRLWLHRLKAVCERDGFKDLHLVCYLYEVREDLRGTLEKCLHRCNALSSQLSGLLAEFEQLCSSTEEQGWVGGGQSFKEACEALLAVLPDLGSGDAGGATRAETTTRSERNAEV